MPKLALNAADAITLYLYGRRYDFYLPRLNANVANTLPAGSFDRAQWQKHQIILHSTAGAGKAEATVNGWVSTSAHFIVERVDIIDPVARPPLRAGAHRTDAGQADAVQAAPEDVVTFHSGRQRGVPGLNATSIGIEHTNRAHGARAEDDLNTFFHVTGNQGMRGADPATRVVPHEYQAYEDEQYATMVMLLRHLCIDHRIPRRFLGSTLVDALGQFLFQRVQPLPPVPGAPPPGDTPAAVNTRSAEIRHYRGILVHNQAHPDKTCPGIIHRNRLFRGVIDQFWLPVDVAGHGTRNYYSGPFRKPAGNTTPSLFHLRRGPPAQFAGTVYRNADLGRLYDTTAFFDFDLVDDYFAAVERERGGTYPVGPNQIWHGGVHFHAPADYPAVFASASGTIVAARLTSNQLTDRAAGFGSQRFVLVQHAVHFMQGADTAGTPPPQGHLGVDRLRTRYDQAHYVYTLYMHLGPFADLSQEHDQNPPWFNIWRRQNPGVRLRFAGPPTAGRCADGERGEVFSPDVEVNIGDVLGLAGRFGGRDHVLHFETFSGRATEFGGLQAAWGPTPWDPPSERVVDADSNLGAAPELGRHLRVPTPDPSAPDYARNLRAFKTYHVSEWALERIEQLEGVIADAAERRRQFEHRRRFSWVADAITARRNHAAANRLAGGDLAARELFSDVTGHFWHYHPIVFISHANRLVRRESTEIDERKHPVTAGINCLIDQEGFIRRFVVFDAAAGDYRPAPATRGALVRPHAIARGGEYHFSLLELACTAAGAHQPAVNPPHETRVSLYVVNLAEEIRNHFGAGIVLVRAHLCTAHRASAPLCVMNDDAHAAEHGDGLALDLAPAAPTPASCRSLVASAEFVRGRFNEDADSVCGNPAWGDVPDGVSQMVVEHPALPATAIAARSFRVHMALRP